MTRFQVSLIVAAYGAVACGNATGPTLQGQWAARGIELTAQPASTELRLPCGSFARIARPLVLGEGNTIRFSARGVSLGNSFTVNFVGHVQNGGIDATVTVKWPNSAPSVGTHILLPGADPQFQSYFCLDG